MSRPARARGREGGGRRAPPRARDGAAQAPAQRGSAESARTCGRAARAPPRRAAGPRADANEVRITPALGASRTAHGGHRRATAFRHRREPARDTGGRSGLGASVTLLRCAGSSGSRPFAAASAEAKSCPGSTERSGERKGSGPGRGGEDVARAVEPGGGAAAARRRGRPPPAPARRPPGQWEGSGRRLRSPTRGKAGRARRRARARDRSP